MTENPFAPSRTLTLHYTTKNDPAVLGDLRLTLAMAIKRAMPPARLKQLAKPLPLYGRVPEETWQDDLARRLVEHINSHHYFVTSLPIGPSHTTGGQVIPEKPEK